MSNTLILSILLLSLAFGLTFFPPQSGIRCWQEYEAPQCNNGVLFDGYWWRGFWVPGMINIPSHFMPAPQYTFGYAVYYAPNVMEATARYMGFDLTNYLDGVAMLSCADIGQTVWIKRWENDYFEGPFLVVDCAEWDDHYPIAVYRREVVEVGWRTAKRWKITDKWLTGVNVWKGILPPKDPGQPVRYSDWFQDIVEYLPNWWTQLPSKPIFKAPHEWLIGGEWIDFLDQEHKEQYLSEWIRNAVYEIGD